MENKPKIYYNEADHELYVIEYVERSGDDDSMFIEVDNDFYIFMHRAAFDKLQLICLGDL